MAETLTALSQRNEAFWIGLTCFALGVVSPQDLFLLDIDLSRTLFLLGGTILVTRLLVGCFRILKTTMKAGLLGYREGKTRRAVRFRPSLETGESSPIEEGPFTASVALSRRIVDGVDLLERA